MRLLARSSWRNWHRWSRPAPPAVAAVGAMLATLLSASVAPGVSLSSAATAPSRSAGHPVGVREYWLEVTDRTRWTVSHGHVLSHSRSLPTMILRPEAAGSFPLVVFAHGYDITPGAYIHLLRHWAAAGFIVAAPRFPLTRAKAGRWLDESDVVNQPQDMSAVLTAVERVLGSRVDRRHVFAAGHSDGGATSFGTGFADRVRDRRWTAVMVFSGDRRADLGRFSAPSRALPLLVVQSNRDEFNSLRSAARVWSVARAPKTYLHLYGARHLPPFAYACVYRDIVESVTTHFLREWSATDSRTRRSARGALDRAGHRPGRSSVTEVVE